MGVSTRSQYKESVRVGPVALHVMEGGVVLCSYSARTYHLKALHTDALLCLQWLLPLPPRNSRPALVGNALAPL